jgi:hypothetical protein
MGSHRIQSPEQGNHRGKHRSGKPYGAKILRAAQRNGSHDASDAETEEAAQFWHSAAQEVNGYQERISGLKNMYAEGLQRLVRSGAYDPRVLRRLSHINVLTTIVEGQDDPYLDHAHAYVDVHGRYIAGRERSDEGVYVHEFTHKMLRMGAPDKQGRHIVGWSLFDEPIAERVRYDVGQVMEIENNVPPTYGAHTRVFDKVLHATGMTFNDITRIASGDDPIENYDQFRSEAMANTSGADIVGWAQQSYVNYADFYKRQHPDAIHFDAIDYAAGMVEQDLDGYLSSQVAAYV